MKDKKNDKKNTEIDLRIFHKKADTIGGVLKTLFYCLTVVACFYLIYLSISHLAGKNTLANIAIGILGDVKVVVGSSILMTGTGVGYGIYQKKSRNKDVKRLTQELIETKQKLDPKRTSSGLTEYGENKKEDFV